MENAKKTRFINFGEIRTGTFSKKVALKSLEMGVKSARIGLFSAVFQNV